MSEQQHQQLGRGMLRFAAIIALALMTWFFSILIEKRNNPNQNIESRINGDFNEVNLQRNRAGHYVATGNINGKTVVFLVDTGATDVAIPGDLAKQLNLENLGTVTMSTANGLSTGYLTRLDELRIGSIVLHDVRASVAPNLSGEILLGMSALGELDWQQRGDQLILHQKY